MLCMHTLDYYLALKKKAILQYVTCLNLEGIMLDEVSQSKKDKHRMIPLLWGI